MRTIAKATAGVRNIRGDLAYVLDSGELGDLRELPDADEF
jgi:hypothetical protein